MPRATGRRSVVPMIHTVNGVGLYVEEHSEEFNLYIKGEEGELVDENVEKGIERSTEPDTAEAK